MESVGGVPKGWKIVVRNLTTIWDLEMDPRVVVIRLTMVQFLRKRFRKMFAGVPIVLKKCPGPV